MDASELFKQCLAQATEVVGRVRTGQFGDPTPDTEWTVKDLANHMLYELSWVPDVVEGKSMAEVGDAYDGDLIGEDAAHLIRAWQVAAARAESAVKKADPRATAHLSYANVTAEAYLREAATDQLIHAWDLGKAIGMNVAFEPQLTEAVYEYSVPRGEMLRSSGLFGGQVAVAPDADLQTKLLALLGRKADWKAS